MTGQWMGTFPVRLETVHTHTSSTPSTSTYQFRHLESSRRVQVVIDDDDDDDDEDSALL